MAEGELELDPKPIPVVKHLEEDADNGLKFNKKEFGNYKLLEAKIFGDRELLSDAKLQLDQGTVHEEKTETEVSEATHTVVDSADNLSGSPKTYVHKTSNDQVANATTKVDEVCQ